MRRALAWLSAVVVTLGVATVPSVATAQTTRTTTSFGTTCSINAPIVGQMDMSPQNPVQIHVTSPESVEIGERFDVTFEIDPISVSLDSIPGGISLQQASRLKLDLQRPAGTRLVGHRFTGGNIDISNAQVITVNENGAPDVNGNVLRLTDNGHHTVGNGGNVATNSHRGLGMDLRGANSLDFEFPRVTLTFEAERAGRADIGVRTQGQAASYGSNPASFLTALASASVPLLGAQWVPAYCSPRVSASAPISPAAAAMKSVTIRGLPTSATLEGPDTVFLRTPAEFVATVDPRIAGEVTFVNGAERVTAPVNTGTGEARAELTFNNPQPAHVIATFTPTNARYAPARTELLVTPERLAAVMTMEAPGVTNAFTRTSVSVDLPAEARGTVTFSGGGQERTVDVRDGRAATSLTFTNPGETEVTAVYAPSAASPYGTATATSMILVEESTATTLVLNGLDEPGYVAEPVILEAVVNPAEGTENPRGRVEFSAGQQSSVVDVVDGRAVAEFTFGREGAVEVTATYHPSGSGQNLASDAGTLQIVDAVATDSQLVGLTSAEPGRATPYTIVVNPAGASGTATVRIDGRVVGTDIPVIDGEGQVSLTFPPSTNSDRTVTVDFTPTDARVLRPHTSQHVVQVAAAPVNEDALTMTIASPESVVPGETNRIRVEVSPENPELAATTLNGYLTATNNGVAVVGADEQPVRIPVVRGIADMDVVWTSGYPASKFLQFTYHSADGAERLSEAITVTVVGAGDGTDTVVLRTAAAGGPGAPAESGELSLGSLSGGGGSLSTTFGS
ncbi:hypothetical protein [Dietzia cinnamea]|uniref:hypothetical protein n=1 Tax=Dietzia cinnamea TaxID=321318 RepID=UPI0021A7862B|nr:hypothetical protein [Dietzia cinnamea]MCT2077736.1 hypothetical protein [Dietzia cinnamea]